jgi:hypothetical protein
MTGRPAISDVLGANSYPDAMSTAITSTGGFAGNGACCLGEGTTVMIPWIFRRCRGAREAA